MPPLVPFILVPLVATTRNISVGVAEGTAVENAVATTVGPAEGTAVGNKLSLINFFLVPSLSHHRQDYHHMIIGTHYSTVVTGNFIRSKITRYICRTSLPLCIFAVIVLIVCNVNFPLLTSFSSRLSPSKGISIHTQTPEIIIHLRLEMQMEPTLELNWKAARKYLEINTFNKGH